MHSGGGTVYGITAAVHDPGGHSMVGDHLRRDRPEKEIRYVLFVLKCHRYSSGSHQNQTPVDFLTHSRTLS